MEVFRGARGLKAHSKQKLCKTVRPSLSRCAIATLRSPVTASPELEMAPAFERPTAENPERDLTQCEPVHFKARTFQGGGRGLVLVRPKERRCHPGTGSCILAQGAKNLYAVRTRVNIDTL